VRRPCVIYLWRVVGDAPVASATIRAGYVFMKSSYEYLFDVLSESTKGPNAARLGGSVGYKLIEREDGETFSPNL
jgi:hypothetical protein